MEKALQIEKFLLYAPNVEVYEVNRKNCIKALKVAEEKGVGLSDAIAYILMLQNNIKEIYSFNRNFDKLEGIKRFTSPTKQS